MEKSTPPRALIILPVSESRKAQQKLLLPYMKTVVVPELEAGPFQGGKVQCLFVQQANQSEVTAAGFNVGAMRNAGYLYLKSLYPDANLSEVTLLFEDVDNYLLNHSAQVKVASTGKVDVYYHYQTGKFPLPFPTLGSIFSITAGDFEKINGFPMVWGWAPLMMEMFKRLTTHEVKIDFSSCKFEASPDVAHMRPLFGSKRAVNGFELYRFSQRDVADGLSSLHIQTWTEDASQWTLFVNEFQTKTKDTPQHRSTVDLDVMSVDYILERASEWYQNAYNHNNNVVQAPVPRTPPGLMTWATREGIEEIHNHIRQHPRNRMQQLLGGRGGGGGF